MFTDSSKDDIRTVKDQGHRGNRASLTIRIKHEESKLGARATRAEDDCACQGVPMTEPSALVPDNHNNVSIQLSQCRSVGARQGTKP